MAIRYAKLARLTGLPEAELKLKHRDFEKKFPSGQVSRQEFRRIAQQLMEDQEVSLFVGNVFKMFDQNNDHRLDFFEFTLATSTKFSMVDEDPREKLEWLFENVYDKDRSGKLSRDELQGILLGLLLEENVSQSKCKELINDIFREIDSNKDGLISRREFMTAASHCELLNKILTEAAEKKKKKKKAGKQ